MKSCGIKIGVMNNKSIYCGDKLLGRIRYCSHCFAINLCKDMKILNDVGEEK